MMTGKSDAQATLVVRLRQAQFLAQELNSSHTATEIERILAQTNASEDEAIYLKQLTNCLQRSCAALLQQIAVIENDAAHLDNNTQKTLHTARLLTQSLQRMFLREIQYINSQSARLDKWSQWESELLEATKQAVWKLFSQTDWPLLVIPTSSSTPFVEKLNRHVALVVKQTFERQASKIQIEIQQELAHTLNHLFAFATTYDQLLQYINTQLVALGKQGPLEAIWLHYDPRQMQRQYQAALELLYTFDRETDVASSSKLAWQGYDSEKIQKRFKSVLDVLQTGELDDSSGENTSALLSEQTSSSISESGETFATPAVNKLERQWQKYHQESVIYTETQTITEIDTAVAYGALGNVFALNVLYARLLHFEPVFDANTGDLPQRHYQTNVLVAIETFLKQKHNQIQQQLNNHIQQQFNLLKNELDQMIDPLQKWFKNFYQEHLGYDPARLQQIRDQINQIQ